MYNFNKKWAFTTALLLFTGLITPVNMMILNTPKATAATWFVDDGGGQDFTTIQDAINWSSPGDYIYVYPGTYNERLTIGKSLNLRGAKFGVDPTPEGSRGNASQESIITEAGLSDPNPNVLIDIANNVTDMFIDGFTLIGDPTDNHADTAAVRYGGSSGVNYNISIRNNLIEGRYGIIFRGGDNLLVYRNRITANKNCMVVQMNAATDVTISENKFRLGSSPQGDESAIYVTSTKNSTISGNNATGFINGKGIAASASKNLTISDNKFYKNKDAISFWGGTTFITIHNNLLNDSKRYGINMKGQDINITNNTITGNTGHGIHIDRHVIDTLRVNIHNNNISGNTGDGVNVSSAQDTINASDNWWGDDSGPGGAGPGTGDNVSSGVTYRTWIETEDPVPDAGENQTINQTEILFFNASGSTDNQGISNYTWSFNDNGTWELYGVAPDHTFNDAGTFNVLLNVTDDVGNWALDSMVVTVNDTIAPIANGGPDRTVDQGATVTFNGSGSSDIVGIVNYTWNFTDMAPQILYEVETLYTYDNAGIFVVMLNVTDAAGNYHTDNVTVTVNDTTNPVANAGLDRAIDQHENLTLNGTLSSDNVGIVDYNWTFDDGGSQILNGVTPWYVFDNAGTFNITLNATDYAGNWHIDNMTVTVNDTTNPVANAGADRAIDQHENLTLNGTLSSDNVGIVDYNWTFDDGGSQILNGVTPWYVFDNAGTFNITLNATDYAGNWHIDNMTVTVNDTTNPVANAGLDRAVDQHENLTLNGTLSSDNVGIVDYNWTFDDGGPQILNGVTPWYVFDNAGTFNITLNATDAAGNWHTDNMTVIVNDTEEPGISADNSPNAGTTGDDFQFNITASDNMNIDTVFVNWSHGNLGNNISLTEVNGYWIATIQLDDDLGDLTYYIYMNDTSGNYNISDLQTVSVSDNDSPLFLNDHASDNGTTGDIFQLNVSTSDNIGIDTVYVNWTHGNLGSNSSLTETNGYWIATIQLDDDLGDLTYYIYINDTSGNYNISSLQTVSLNDNDNPVIGLLWNSTLTTGDLAVFSINITDNIALQTIMFNFTIDGLDNHNWTVTNNSGTSWGINVTLPSDSASIEYYFWTNDTTGNINRTVAATLDIADNDIPELVEELTQRTPTTGDLFTVLIDAIDNIGVMDVYLNYTYNGEDYYNDTMIFDLDGYWNKTVTIDFNAERITYRFFIWDAAGNLLNTITGPGFINVSDNDAPVFVSDNTTGIPTTGDPYTILVNAQDNIGVINLSVNYTFDGVTYQNESMYFDNDELWNRTINVSGNGTFLRYRFHISDAAGNTRGTSRPEINVRDNDAPSLIDATLEPPRTGETSNLSVDVMDNIGVSSLYVRYTFDGTDYLQDPFTNVVGNTWEGAITIIIDATFLNYSFIVTDIATNELDTSETIGESHVNVSDIIKPTVNAGVDLLVDQNTNVTLNGGDSSDNVAVGSFIWTFTYDDVEKVLFGPEVYFNFTIAGTYSIWLNVTDKAGNWNSDNLTVHVKDITKPRAEAGNSKVIDQHQNVTFDGSGSSDNVIIVSYQWKFIYNGSEVILTGEKTNFTFHTAGTYIVTLNVTDEVGNWNTSNIAVEVRDITLPTADAGGSLIVEQHEKVIFDGGSSKDNVRIMNYSWSFIYDGIENHMYGREVNYTFHIAGAYLISLNVSDHENNWDHADLLLTVLDITKPTAVARIDTKLDLNAQAHFDGSGSSDNVGLVNWTWSFPYGPDIVKLYGMNVSFTFGITGEYRVTLRVTDERGLFDTATVLVDVYERTNIEAVPGEILETELKDKNGNVVARLTVSGNGTLDVKRLEWSDLVDEMGELPEGKRHIDMFVEITIDELDWLYIEIPYDETELPKDTGESSLRIYFWNSTSSQWEEAEETGVDVDGNFVWANVTHLTIFAPMASEMKTDAEGWGDLSTTTLMGIGFIVILLILVTTFAIMLLKEKKRDKKGEVEPVAEVKKIEAKEAVEFRCPDCDSELKEEDSACPECGLEFEEEDDDDDDEDEEWKEEDICPECGEDMEGDVDICPHCGFQMKVEAKESEDGSKGAFKEAPEGERICPGCWEDVEDDVEICVHCGRSLKEETGSMCPDCGGTMAPEDDACSSCGKIPEKGDICPRCSSMHGEDDLACPECGFEFQEWDEDIENIENELDGLILDDEEEDASENGEGSGENLEESGVEVTQAEGEQSGEADAEEETPMEGEVEAEEDAEQIDGESEGEDEKEKEKGAVSEPDPEEAMGSIMGTMEVFEHDYICPKCSITVKQDASFCPNCGVRFESEETMLAKEDQDQVVGGKKGRYIEPDKDYDFEVILSPYEDAEMDID